ncbi:hypothetical protein BJ684DRAFT_19802 [Piptocephalis cylindrospora]|uniref:Uncharacterized protein n=1 Tax=Piptocephalis cylindrospora TaxID=1907219 RepID=A0A4P9Y686_9FUNG|nr:hypothetical protein BJ684DRAFT_19802 [Piptocephalis cylindrospora]|eukprot:RKP13741.1 hypothetical protein BJ684DRAFT_19802 [Piptocephalis cylindrospora]
MRILAPTLLSVLIFSVVLTSFVESRPGLRKLLGIPSDPNKNLLLLRGEICFPKDDCYPVLRGGFWGCRSRSGGQCWGQPDINEDRQLSANTPAGIDAYDPRKMDKHPEYLDWALGKLRTHPNYAASSIGSDYVPESITGLPHTEDVMRRRSIAEKSKYAPSAHSVDRRHSTSGSSLSSASRVTESRPSRDGAKNPFAANLASTSNSKESASNTKPRHKGKDPLYSRKSAADAFDESSKWMNFFQSASSTASSASNKDPSYSKKTITQASQLISECF